MSTASFRAVRDLGNLVPLRRLATNPLPGMVQDTGAGGERVTERNGGRHGERAGRNRTGAA
ncbi:MAG TPA: hypothetical protein VMW65_05120, partial [Chloroflexota bacterium]|nr:hypothetical protein [Chloroflexota bacterium]